MKIVIAPDSFKGSLSAVESAEAIERGVKKALPESDTTLVPIADGGEGTLETLVVATGGFTRSVSVMGPLGDEVEAMYGILGDGETCVIEMASASGIGLVPKGDLNPFLTTTYGTGELIAEALDEGYRKFILAIGGSATNDGGAGMLQALGVRLLNESGGPVGMGGGSLTNIRSIDLTGFDQRISSSTFLIASDVENPLIGPSGASYVFGPQKGASPEGVKVLDRHLEHWADVVEHTTGVSLHDKRGAGAAGGIGGAFQAFFPSKMERGIDVVIRYTNLEGKLVGADLVVTGEGRVDSQTASGKTPMGVAQAANDLGIPTVVMAGSVGDGINALYPYGVIGVHSMLNRPMTLEVAMKEASALLESSTEQVVRSFFHSHVHNKQGGLVL
ncbi:glycerate kinase [Guptibacillus algicola]|uniref:glycerate kinase n=1 Tax=Guptibacillus algicola TaxID=225844 RepID=UPI001CD3E189|nr:glycerate kinase [Alkalihalobacillus algicola]MCA0987301.1 glycerate kinase [Alkalihalobacillus algicola]